MTDASNPVDDAIASRRSVRAFLPTPVPRRTVEEILAVSSRAPSGTNMQPWKVHVVTGAAKDRLAAAVRSAFLDHRGGHEQEYKYYPDRFPEPYLTRRRKVGWDLYGLLGIEKGDTGRMRQQHARNHIFFDAPVGMIFTIDRALEIGSWLDYGMFLENIMVAARGRGLDTCPQAAFAPFHKVIRAELGIPESEIVICGMSLGYGDPDAPENGLVTERAPIGEFATFHDV
jgi:nitroreductase